MVRATYRLSLLCKATMRLTPDIHQMVREYLVIRVGVPCPHVDDMLWRCAPQWGDFGFVLVGTVYSGILPDKPLAVEEETEDPVEVEFMMRDRPGRCTWSVHHDNQKILVMDSSVTKLLENFRQHFDGRVPGPGCGMRAIVEAPCTPQQWEVFVRRWVFGPSKPKQISLHRWLPPGAAPGRATQSAASPYAATYRRSSCTEAGYVGHMAATTGRNASARQDAAGPSEATDRQTSCNEADYVG